MTDLLKLLGLPASIGIVFGAIFGSSIYFEKIADPNFKASISNFLQSATWQTWATRLPEVIEELFQLTFGAKHFSLKCLRRSIGFSIGAIAILLLLGFINHYSYFKTMPNYLRAANYQIIFFGWIMWAILIDYLNLFKTRLFIRVAASYRWTAFVFGPVIAFDFVLSIVVFILSYEFLDTLNMSYQACANVCSFKQGLLFAVQIYKDIGIEKAYWADKISYLIRGPTATEIGVFFWAGMLPTLWLCLYLLATKLTAVLSPLSTILVGTFGALNIKEYPIQSIGFVAAILAAIGIAIYYSALHWLF